MECPKCGQERTPEQTRCDHCDIVFAKYETYLARKAELDQRRATRGPGLGERLADTGRALLTPPPAVSQYWPAYALLWIACLVWFASYAIQGLDGLGHEPGFMHAINLPFHEAGHVIFSPFGELIGSLGGTLGQLLIPIICGIALLRTSSDTFGASLCFAWFGQNWLDIAPYMADARAGRLPLLGGNYGQSSPYGFHDWEFILGETGLLAWDTTLAAITLNGGRLLMLAGFTWGAWLLIRARQRPE